eukprot:gnl/TRDRNA2_/TRDRNA2_160597_c0_seq1.p1 gnl/TRDRNA2_/TRDRNA2_160597_c0~~gnl/TRDRNA2_/TRDRNA2_160597_c0_seq1.p1  ORF type:complete len:671 (+),score=101.03 gnl/TRDRNA2_/TRDRNA2_160597_c0_seq1:77-2089(+)
MRPGVMKAVVVSALFGCTLGFPSFRLNIPNGERVPCPAGATGCTKGDVSKGQPSSYCSGVGHQSCKGGSMPLNPFGLALQAADYKWTKELCEADSDEDGLTNGEELGDPCCLWEANDHPSSYTSSFVASHPGFGDDASRKAQYSRPACSETAPGAKATKLGLFNEGEEQRVAEIKIANFTIPTDVTAYEDIAFNFPDDSADTFHVVFAEAIVTIPQLHHFVLYGCKGKFPEKQDGHPIKGMRSRDCGSMWGGWAPGQSIIEAPPWAAKPLGKGVGIESFVINVHYDNPTKQAGVVSQDGIRFYYTPTLRGTALGSMTFTAISLNPTMRVPPGKKRFFITRSCTLQVYEWKEEERRLADHTGEQHADEDSLERRLGGHNRPRRPESDKILKEAHVYSGSYHAHLLGRQMMMEITLKDQNSSFALVPSPHWHFDDQGAVNLLNENLTLKTGDHIQSTCIFDSTGRSEDTFIGEETSDEMCWATLGIWPGTRESSCTGHVWSGELGDDEPLMGIAERHPEENAAIVWDGSSSTSGGQLIKRPEGVSLTDPRCKDAELFGDFCPLLIGQALQEKKEDGKSLCSQDMGETMGFMEGATMLSMCCTQACSLMCGEEELCKRERPSEASEEEKEEEATEEESTEEEPSVSSSSYRVTKVFGLAASLAILLFHACLFA